MIKGSVQEEDIIIVNICVPNIGAPQYLRQTLIDIYFCFIDYAKAFDCVDHNKLRNILKEIGKDTT